MKQFKLRKSIAIHLKTLENSKNLIQYNNTPKLLQIKMLNFAFKSINHLLLNNKGMNIVC